MASFTLALHILVLMVWHVTYIEKFFKRNRFNSPFSYFSNCNRKNLFNGVTPYPTKVLSYTSCFTVYLSSGTLPLKHIPWIIFCLNYFLHYDSLLQPLIFPVTSWDSCVTLYFSSTKPLNFKRIFFFLEV